MISRRDFIKGAAATGVLGLTGCNSSFSAKDVRTVKHQINLPDQFSDFSGYKIAFLTDIHEGPYLPPVWFETAIKKLKELEYDLLTLGGDYINIPDKYNQKKFYPRHNQLFKSGESTNQMVHKAYKSVFGEISQTNSKKEILAVFGNHDQWMAPDLCQDYATRSGINLLINHTYKIKRGDKQLCITGVDDYWTGFPKLRANQYSVDSNTYNIIISHNPDFISETKFKKNVDFNLALCGHTHGGQINFPLFGSLHYNVNDLRFIKDLIKLEDFTHVFTSNGLGMVEIPYRLNCPPEICLIELV